MKHLRLVAGLFFLVVGCCGAGQASPLAQLSDHKGYIQCASKKNPAPIPVFDDICTDKPNGTINCGEEVTILERRGPWLKVKAASGREVYLGVFSVSGVKNKFVLPNAPVDVQYSRHECAAARAARLPEGTHTPKAVYAPDPEFPQNNRTKHFYGTVVLSVTVGIDGRPHNIAVEKSLTDDFDRNAITALKQWEFDPAVKDGKPVEARIMVEINFRRD